MSPTRSGTNTCSQSCSLTLDQQGAGCCHEIVLCMLALLNVCYRPAYLHVLLTRATGHSKLFICFVPNRWSDSHQHLQVRICISCRATPQPLLQHNLSPKAVRATTASTRQTCIRFVPEDSASRPLMVCPLICRATIRFVGLLRS